MDNQELNSQQPIVPFNSQKVEPAQQQSASVEPIGEVSNNSLLEKSGIIEIIVKFKILVYILAFILAIPTGMIFPGLLTGFLFSQQNPQARKMGRITFLCSFMGILIPVMLASTFFISDIDQYLLVIYNLILLAIVVPIFIFKFRKLNKQNFTGSITKRIGFYLFCLLFPTFGIAFSALNIFSNNPAIRKQAIKIFIISFVIPVVVSSMVLSSGVYQSQRQLIQTKVEEKR